MNPISLGGNWQMIVTETADFRTLPTGDTVWSAVSLPSDSSESVMWVRCLFHMPPNDACATWWLELDVLVSGVLWVNGRQIGRLDDDDPPQLDITHALRMGKNVAAIRLEDSATAWRRAVCVPYPCA